ncbi:MAG: hypothetical protein ACLGSD_05855 [Acidobacteriota bacterium]
MPLYDFHIFAGTPHASLIQPGCFYLPSYIALILSKTIWGHPFATLDILAMFHALLAIAGCYVLLRSLGTSNTVAAFGALTSLSGFFLWCGRTWPFVPALCAYFPWILWASLRYFEKPSLKRAAPLLFLRLGLLYVGYPQYFLLACIFEHLFVMLYTAPAKQPDWLRRCAFYLALDIPTFLLGLPLILPAIAEIGRSFDRATKLTYGMFSTDTMSPLQWLVGQWLVFVPIRLPKDAIDAALPFLSQIGYLPSLLSFGAVMLWKKQPKRRALIAASLVCILLALLWGWNVLGPLLYHVPLLNRFRFPFKLIYFAGFFQCLLAALVLTRWNQKWQFLAVGGFVLNWLWVFCLLPSHAWRIREYHPPLQSPWHDTLKTGRYIIIDQNPISSPPGDFAHFNYSLLWGFDNLFGYEPMLSRFDAELLFKPSYPDLHAGSFSGPMESAYLQHLKQWSVRYILLSSSRPDMTDKVKAAGFQRRSTNGTLTLWEDPHFLPRVRPANPADASGVRWTVHANSVDVALEHWSGGELTMAFAANPGLQTCFENRCIPVARSSDGMIHVNLPPGTSRMRLVYRNRTFNVAAVISGLTLVVLIVLFLRAENRRPPALISRAASEPALSPKADREAFVLRSGLLADLFSHRAASLAMRNASESSAADRG